MRNRSGLGLVLVALVIGAARVSNASDCGSLPGESKLRAFLNAAPGTGGRMASRPNSMVADSTRTSAGTTTRMLGGSGGASRRRLRAAPMTRSAATVPRVTVHT